MNEDEFFMREAVAEAERALACDEIPIGAVVVLGDKIIGRGFNVRLLENSPLGHAEIAAMTDAARAIGSWRFDRCTIYSTLEPCVMCAGAIVQCRMRRIVFGARDAKAGGCRSLYEIANDPRMYHRCEVTEGIMRSECAELLRKFFAKKRKR
ncbi:MAG: tRNA adenosine(34) deaminase TadA [Synergistes sp.]|nr:tRNA adenosine(34) deaminase TadA [Synergistes sp.]